MENEDSTSNDVIDFPDQRKYLETIGKAEGSEPTKNKVVAFKMRVFKLVKLYAEKARNLTPLFDSLNQDLFAKEPERMNQVVLQVINRQVGLDNVRLTQLLDIYKVLLLYKTKNEVSNKLSQTFVKLLKRTLNEGGQEVVKEMIEKVFTKRNCKLNVNFFQFLLRKIPTCKPLISQSCEALLSQKSMRPAQIKQLKKLKDKISKQKQNPVKQEVKKQQVKKEDNHEPKKKAKKQAKKEQKSDKV